MKHEQKEYLVRDGDGRWEICHAGVFPRYDNWATNLINQQTEILNPAPECRRPALGWANRHGAFVCWDDEAVDVKELPE